MKRAIVLVLAGLIIGTTAIAQPMGGGRGGNGGGGPDQMFADLNLTAEQQGKLRELRRGKQQLRNELGAIHEARAALMTTIRDPQASDDAVRQAGARVHGLMTKLHTERIERLIDMRKILTPEQLETFIARMEDRGPGKKFGQGPKTRTPGVGQRG